MVALAVESIRGRIPTCTARPFLDAANDAYEAGQEIKAACLLRESIRRYLLAHCEYAGVPLPASPHPLRLIDAYIEAGNECCPWVREIVVACNQVMNCRKSLASMEACLSIAYSLFADDFKREGGAV